MNEELAKQSADAADKNRTTMQNILDLGRIFEMSIDKFIDERGDIDGQVVVGATDYIIKTYKERMAAMGEKYGRLKKAVEKEGIKIHEPYVNDGIEPAMGVGFDVSPSSSMAKGSLMPRGNAIGGIGIR